MITITPLGVANRGPAQACVIQYKEKKFTSQLFDYTFQSKSYNNYYVYTNCLDSHISLGLSVNIHVHGGQMALYKLDVFCAF